ncbi:MAG: hypothetical protein ACFB4I_17775 [Cyanophyceae cyanobacterium]
MRIATATLLISAVSFACLILTAEAKVLKEGAVSNGYYWQLIEHQDGSTRWLCRKVQEGRFQKHKTCQQAQAERP